MKTRAAVAPQTRATIGNNGGQSCPPQSGRSPDRNQSNGYLPYRTISPAVAPTQRGYSPPSSAMRARV